MPPSFPRMFDVPELPPGEAPSNYVTLATVGQDESDPTRAFTFVDASGQVLVEVRLHPDGDKTQAFLCLEQSGPGAGGFVPVGFGDTVIVVFPDGDFSSGYIVGRVADIAQPLAPVVAGITTTGPSGQVAQFRWLVTPRGQVYAIAPTGELMLSGGASGVQVDGAQILLNGPTHLGGAFVSPPVPGEIAGGGQETAPVPAGPFVPTPGATLTTPPYVGLAKGIVRATDGVQSNAAIDPVFWQWVLAVTSFLTITQTAIDGLTAGAFTPLLIAAQADMLSLVAAGVFPPTELASQHMDASATHTCAD